MNSTTVLTLGLSAALLLSACGQNDDAPAESGTDPARTKALTEALFNYQDENEFHAAVKAARAGKVSEQAILEARFLFCIDQRDDTGIATLAPEMLAREGRFQVEDSAIFGFVEEWQSVVHFAQALAALKKNNPARFKKHITEAYWLSPRDASVFTPYIEELRLETAMTKVRLDFQQAFPELDATNRITLADLVGDASHLLLHFWSPWADECITSADDFAATTNELTKNNIAVAAVLADSTPDLLPDAAAFRADLTEIISCTWLIDDPRQPLGRILRVTDLPTVVLVNKSGSILFNGHPSHPKLWNHLQQVAPKLVRPKVQPTPPLHEPSPSE